MTTAHLIAHGVGGRQDLPVPLSEALTGAVMALVATFVLVAGTRSPPCRPTGRTLPARIQRAVDARLTRRALGLAGVLAAAWFTAAVLAGDPDPARNAAPGMLYVLLWVGVPLASLVCGPVWRRLNPLRFLYGLVTPRPRRPYPEAWGYRPAALLLASFAWLELVAPNRTSPAVVGAYAGAYAVVAFGGAVVFGPRWFARADAFEVYSTLVARMSPLGRGPDGRLVLRSPLAGLAALPVRPGLRAMVLVLLGSTAYDGLSGAPFWIRLRQDGPLPDAVTGTLGLAAAITVVSAGYALAAAAADRIARHRPGTARQFAPAVLPVALGYVVAHYVTLLLTEGQRTVILASDPFGTGADLLGLADRAVDDAVLTPATTSHVQIVSVIAGHVVGTIATHDTADRTFTAGRVASQLPMLSLMVLYTVTGLGLLLA
ncbi:hypothetical protein [Streptomyces sp. 184]|uniref:hypothetical protein n=1 Tax=Streptomyces sp. 184 TaxID=1827526 RepID=UPI0038926243